MHKRNPTIIATINSGVNVKLDTHHDKIKVSNSYNPIVTFRNFLYFLHLSNISTTIPAALQLNTSIISPPAVGISGCMFLEWQAIVLFKHGLPVRKAGYVYNPGLKQVDIGQNISTTGCGVLWYSGPLIENSLALTCFMFPSLLWTKVIWIQLRVRYSQLSLDQLRPVSFLVVHGGKFRPESWFNPFSTMCWAHHYRCRL